MTRDGRRLLLFFNIEPIPRVKWPAALLDWLSESGGGGVDGDGAIGGASRRVRGEHERRGKKVGTVFSGGSSCV